MSLDSRVNIVYTLETMINLYFYLSFGYFNYFCKLKNVNEKYMNNYKLI